MRPLLSRPSRRLRQCRAPCLQMAPCAVALLTVATFFSRAAIATTSTCELQSTPTLSHTRTHGSSYLNPSCKPKSTTAKHMAAHAEMHTEQQHQRVSRRDMMAGGAAAAAAVGATALGSGAAKASESAIIAPAIAERERRVVGSGADALEINPVVNGLWQVSGAHGRINPEKAVGEMFKYVEAGLTTWDAADIYGPAELVTREFRKQYKVKYGQEPPIQVLTKYVPRPGPMPYELIEAAVDSRLERLGVESIDLLQFHWWDYKNKNYIDAMKHMKKLKNQGKIRNLALTNFDTEHMRELVEDHDIPIVSNQVQFSMLDRRPLNKMIPFAAKHDIKLLAYGVLCGGLLTDKYLGVRDPSETIDTASKQKYWYGTINEWGGWQLFQKLLKTLREVGDGHGGASIANVAERYILDQPQVAGVLIGARLSKSEHISDNLNVYTLSLTDEDYAKINAVLDQGKMLKGDCGDEYRSY